MKIAWFTPFSEKSAIGKYSKLATDALCKNAMIDIFTFDNDQLLLTNLKIIRCTENENLISRLFEYDIIIYNMGDNSVYHQNIYEVLQRKRGIIIIHDATLLGFYYGYYCNHKNDSNQFKMIYEKTYDDPVENASARYMSDEGIKYGFMELITKFCTGIIVHSDFHADIIRKIYDGPLKRIYFPFTQEYLSTETINKDNEQIDLSKLNILTVGNVNRNKHVLEVVHAIGRSGLLMKSVNYTIIGAQGDRAYIEEIENAIKSYGLSDNIKLLGYVNDASLAAYYNDADILCNLRNPALEGASWSLVEQMSLAKPIIVSDNGFYSEIPDDCVFKIGTDNEEESLIKILGSIIKDRSILHKKGEKAKKLVEDQFSQKQYAQALVSFTEELIYGKSMESLIYRLSNSMSHLGITKDMKIIDTVSEQMEMLFSKKV